MSEALASLFDLELAWKRIKADLPKRVFVRHPYEVELIEQDLVGWLDFLLNAVRNNQYRPSSMVVCDVPKGKGAVRPAGHLLMEDRLIYAACVSACFPQIYQILSWSQETIDFSYQLANDPNKPKWLIKEFEGWKNFRESSLSKIEKGISYVVIADISGYYENIDIKLLISDIKQINAPTEVVNQLSICLNKWSQIEGRGIPQGHSPSDILGKIYLNSVDQNLKAIGYTHCRYVDDIRIFCRNRVEAKKALVDLTRLLRKRGLNLQSAKSEILRADIAKLKIEGISPIIKGVCNKFIENVKQIYAVDNPYVSTIFDADKILESNPDDTPIKIIRETYQSYFIDSINNSSFDKILFHFLLKRLGKAKDKFAVEHCKTLFERHPEETSDLLDYFNAVGTVADVEDTIVAFLSSEDAVYPYQIYQIIEWLGQVSTQPTDKLLSIARDLAFDNSQPPYLRCVCRKFIGDFGLVSDLERLEYSYTYATNSLDQSEIMCCLKRLEKGRRNAFLTRAEGDGELNRRAARLVKDSGG